MPQIIITSCFGERYWRRVRSWVKNLRRFEHLPIEIVSLDGVRYQRRSKEVSTHTADRADAKYGDGDVARLERILEHLKAGSTCFQIDIDVRMKRPFRVLGELPYEFIISRAFDYPPFAAERLSFVACTGFYIAKPAALGLLQEVLHSVDSNEFGTRYDQYVVNAMMTQAADKGRWRRERVCLDSTALGVDVFFIGGVRVAVLPSVTILRNADVKASTFGNHDLVFLETPSSRLLKYTKATLKRFA